MKKNVKRIESSEDSGNESDVEPLFAIDRVGAPDVAASPHDTGREMKRKKRSYLGRSTGGTLVIRGLYSRDRDGDDNDDKDDDTMVPDPSTSSSSFAVATAAASSWARDTSLR